MGISYRDNMGFMHIICRFPKLWGYPTSSKFGTHGFGVLSF